MPNFQLRPLFSQQRLNCKVFDCDQHFFKGRTQFHIYKTKQIKNILSLSQYFWMEISAFILSYDRLQMNKNGLCYFGQNDNPICKIIHRLVKILNLIFILKNKIKKSLKKKFLCQHKKISCY